MGCTKQSWCKWSLLSLLLTIAASAWITLAFYFSIATDVQCVLTGLVGLAALQPVSGASTAGGLDLQDVQDAIASIPRELLDLMDTYSRFAAVLTALPGALACMFLLIAICCANKREGGACCTKTMIVFFDIFAVLQFGVCLFAGGAGIATTQPSVTSITGDFEAEWADTCSHERALLTNATQSLSGEERQLADSALRTVDGLCTCLSRVFADVQGLIPSGFAGAGFMLVAFIAAQYACCLKSKAAPVGAADKNRRAAPYAADVQMTAP